MDKLKLNIITPNGIEYDKLIDSIMVNTYKGKMIFNKNYAPTIGTINLGTIEINDSSNTYKKDVGNGIFIINDNLLKIVVDFVIDHNDTNKSNFELKQRQNAILKLKESTSNKKINLDIELMISKIKQELSNDDK